MSSKYQSLNVLNTKKFTDLQDRDTIAEISSMINASGNRSQRRKLEKTLSKTENILAKCEKSARDKADQELGIRSDDNFMYIFACVGLTLNEDYNWTEDPDEEYGQLTMFFEKLTKKMENYANQGYSTEDIVNLLDEKTGISLICSSKVQ